MASADKETNELRKEIENRERGLFPIYNKIALMYAQLHDTPQRMKDVRVIKEVVPWRQSRKYFYWRLRRKLNVGQSVEAIIGDMGLEQKEWKQAQNVFDEIVADDQTFVEWFCSKQKEFEQFRHDLKMKSTEAKLARFVKQFGGKNNDLKKIFDKLMDEQADVVNID